MFYIRRNDPVTHARFPQVPATTFVKLERQSEGAELQLCSVVNIENATPFERMQDASDYIQRWSETEGKFGRTLFIEKH